MSLTNYRRGYDKERRIVNKFRDRGCIALRSAGSHSPIDVVVIDKVKSEVILIQSKLGYLSPGKAEQIRLSGAELNGEYVVRFELWN